MANDGINADMTLENQDTEYAEKIQANEMNFIDSVHRSLISLGADKVLERRDKKHIRITNFLAINYFIGALVYLLFALFWEKWDWFAFLLCTCLINVAVLILNSLGKVNVSRIVFILAINSLIFLQTLVIGKGALGLNYFFIGLIIPFLIYDIRQSVLIMCGLLVPLFLVYIYDTLEVYFLSYNLLPYQMDMMAKLSVALQFILVITSVLQFVLYNRKAERELEYSNAQMMLQTSELKRSNSDLEQFAYIISHDLKAPVRNISSFMNLLMNKYGGEMKPEAKEFVTYSQTGAKRLERLIDDVLAYCRIGINLPKPIPVNLNDVISTIRFEQRDKMAAINASININKELPIVSHVHSTLMYHVFQNLIANGLKFNKNEQPEININYTNSLNFYTFSVADNGIGISKEYEKTIFQMFKRLHNETEYDGTGIGLAICKKIIEYYNGEIWFDSEQGKGTTFHFTVRKF